MTKTLDGNRLDICVDCLMVVANGEPVSDEHSRSMLRHMEGLEDYSIVITERGEGHFSWSHCDTCNSHLGGTRYEAILMAR